jgi:kojibiose phosphorylase
VEDAASGVAAGLAAGMRVVGLGPPQRVGRAHLVLDSLAELDARRILALLPSDD